MSRSSACETGWHEDCPATNDRPEDRVMCDCECGHVFEPVDPLAQQKIARATGSTYLVGIEMVRGTPRTRGWRIVHLVDGLRHEVDLAEPRETPTVCWDHGLLGTNRKLGVSPRVLPMDFYANPRTEYDQVCQACINRSEPNRHPVLTT